jgi:hypothetical protein
MTIMGLEEHLCKIYRTFQNTALTNKTTVNHDVSWNVIPCGLVGLYRVFHDLWTLLQEVIS